jgi:hypothetical protein
MPLRRAALAAPLLVLLLAGCVDSPTEPVETPTFGYTTRPSSIPTPSPTPTPSATPGPTSEPFAIACSDLISADEIYEYNPNFGNVDEWVPSPGTAAGDGIAAQGTACRWQNQSSGATIDVSVAHLLGSGLSGKRADVAASSTPASWAIEGYFLANGGSGVAQAFTGEYWITVESTTFFAAEDVTPIIEYISEAF